MTDLVRLTAAQKALAEVETADDAKALYDKLEALSQYARRYGVERGKQNEIATLKLRTARKGGALIPDEFPRGNLASREVSLADAGITHSQSSRWQALARIPDEAFDSYVTEQQASEDGEVTLAGALRLAASTRMDERDDAPPLPEGQFRCIVLDPPWPMKKILREVAPAQQSLDYRTLSLEEIAALPIPSLAADGCHIYLWVTHKFLPDGLRLLEGWGARYECALTWVKNVGFTPFSWMYDTEHVLFGRIGALEVQQKGLRLSFSAPVTKHSEKPDVFYERVIDASPEPRLEMFARTPREGFTVWGAEAVAV